MLSTGRAGAEVGRRPLKNAITPLRHPCLCPCPPPPTLADGEMPVVKVDRAIINGKTLQANHGIT